MERIFHSWDKWEDYRYNFYGGIDCKWEKDDSLKLYADLLRDLPEFEQALITITRDWKFSCEHNLTHVGLNRIAYLGQAACALLYKVPHNVCMPAYNLLSDSEKAAADALAEKYLNLWIEKHVTSKKVQ